MRPGPTGWAIVLFLGVLAITGEGRAAEPREVSDEVGVAEARARWVLDRIEEEVAVIVDGEGARTVPRRALGDGAREGDLLDERLAPDPAATARAREGLARLCRRVRAVEDVPRRSGEEAAPRDPAPPGEPRESP